MKDNQNQQTQPPSNPVRLMTQPPPSPCATVLYCMVAVEPAYGNEVTYWSDGTVTLGCAIPGQTQATYGAVKSGPIGSRPQIQNDLKPK